MAGRTKSEVNNTGLGMCDMMETLKEKSDYSLVHIQAFDSRLQFTLACYGFDELLRALGQAHERDLQLEKAHWT